MIHDFSGYHGTSLNSAKEIIDGSFEPSKGDKEWIGDGAYFFLKGLSSKPEGQAKEWAIAQSWDKIQQKYRYKKYCVIKSDISVEDNVFLDLTAEDGLEVLDYLIEKLDSKMSSIGKKLQYVDGLVINLARAEKIFNIDVVKGNFYIKFTANRMKRINLRTSNCTICSVFRPEQNVVKSSIISIGEITL